MGDLAKRSAARHKKKRYIEVIVLTKTYKFGSAEVFLNAGALTQQQTK